MVVLGDVGLGISLGAVFYFCFNLIIEEGGINEISYSLYFSRNPKENGKSFKIGGRIKCLGSFIFIIVPGISGLKVQIYILIQCDF